MAARQRWELMPRVSPISCTRKAGRTEDLKYIATVLDHYPWNEEGWWASTIDVATGESKVPMTKPSIINKTAAIAMAAGIVSAYVRDIDPNSPRG